jgi:hypothetical protein
MKKSLTSPTLPWFLCPPFVLLLVAGALFSLEPVVPLATSSAPSGPGVAASSDSAPDLGAHYNADEKKISIQVFSLNGTITPSTLATQRTS